MKRIIEILGVTVVVVGGFFVIKKMSGKTTPASTTTTEQAAADSAAKAQAAADSAAKQAAAAQAAAQDPDNMTFSQALITATTLINSTTAGCGKGVGFTADTDLTHDDYYLLCSIKGLLPAAKNKVLALVKGLETAEPSIKKKVMDLSITRNEPLENTIIDYVATTFKAQYPTLLELRAARSVTLTTPSATQNVSNNGITDYEKTQIDKAIVQLKKPLPNNYYYDAQVLAATINKIQDMDKATITVLESQAASNQEELFYTLVDNYAPPRKKHVPSTPIADPITGTGGNYVDKINSHMGFYGVKQ